jgi:hypothetical protein
MEVSPFIFQIGNAEARIPGLSPLKDSIQQDQVFRKDGLKG